MLYVVGLVVVSLIIVIVIVIIIVVLIDRLLLGDVELIKVSGIFGLVSCSDVNGCGSIISCETSPMSTAQFT